MSKRRTVFLPDHPLSPPQGYILKSRVALYAKIGHGPHVCHWCGLELWWMQEQRRLPRSKRLLADHLDADVTNDAPENLVASCYGCNSSRGHHPMEPGDPFVLVAGVRNRATKMACVECNKDFLIPTSQLTTRKGRFCSRACRNRGVAKEAGVAIAEGELFLEIQEKHRVKRVRAVEKNCGQCQKKFLAELRFAEKRECCSVSCASKLTAVRRKAANG